MKKRGFTLIELLVVIAIIAILAAILFPVFLSAKERGRQVRCCSNLKQLTMAFLAYTDDNNGFLPISQRRQMIAAGVPNAVEWTGSQWSAFNTPPVPCDVRVGSIYMGGYARNVFVFNCPSDQDLPNYYNGVKIAWSNPASWPPGATAATAVGLPAGFGVTYSMNEDLTSKLTTGSRTTIKLSAAVGGRTGKVLFLIHEVRGKSDGNPAGQNDGYFQWTGGANDTPGKVHWDGTTCSYADSHVKWISNNEIKRIQAMNPSPWRRNSFYYNVSRPEYTE